MKTMNKLYRIFIIPFLIMKAFFGGMAASSIYILIFVGWEIALTALGCGVLGATGIWGLEYLIKKFMP